ncbi:MAG TPA: hypothetical protein VGM56_22485 [Byssovorax sp.]|jgi:hypothetical protein
MHSFHFIMGVASLGLVACGGSADSPGSSDGSGAGSPTSTSANGDGGATTGPGAGGSTSSTGPAGDVTGTSIDTRITESGETMGPTEGYTVAALVGSTKIPGTVHADGSFTISGVPAGVFTLEVTTSDGVTLFVVTAERTFDLGSVIQGRADKANATRTTNVTLALTGAAPWISTDELNFYSLGADAWDEFNFDATPPPHVGATSIGGRLDYEFAFSPGLVDTAKGDVPYLVDLVTAPLSGVPVTAAAKVFSPTSLTMQDGHAAAIAGAFVDVPQTSHATISWKRSAFAAFADAAFPGATLVDHELSFFAEPAGPGRQSDGGSAVLVDALDTASTDVDLPIDFGNPYPASWSTIAVASVFFDEEIPLPGGGTADAYSYASSEMPLAAADGGTFAPLIGPPTGLLLGGHAAQSAALTAVGATPTFAWTAPALGAPAAYQVTIEELIAADHFFSFVANIVTDQTSITIPSGVLEAGHKYRATVTSNSTWTTAAPNRIGDTIASASASTTGFSP